MSKNDTGRLESHRSWGSTLFLAAGGMFIVAAAVVGVGMLTDAAVQQTAGVVAPAAFAIGFAALFGLYPVLADRSPWLARAVAVLITVGAVGHVALAAANLGQLVGVVQDRPAWVGPLNLTRFFALAGFLVFGVASLRSDADVRTLGVLLILLPVIDVVGFGSLASGAPEWLLPVFIGAQALVLLAIGYSIRTEDGSTERAELSAEATP